MILRRINIRMSGLGGQGAVTAAHVMAMAAAKDGSSPFPIRSLGLKSAWPRQKAIVA